MNISTNCNYCIKGDVCRYKDEYQIGSNDIKNQLIGNEIIEVSIKCTKFSPARPNERAVEK